jgi:malonate decarboxylase beta subunit
LVWRTTGGKHRFLMGDCQYLVDDNIESFRQAAEQAIKDFKTQAVPLTLESLEAEQKMLSERISQFGQMPEPFDIWRALGIQTPEKIALLDAQEFMTIVKQQTQKTGVTP